MSVPKKDIIRLRDAGLTYSEIAREVGCSRQAIHQRLSHSVTKQYKEPLTKKWHKLSCQYCEHQFKKKFIMDIDYLETIKCPKCKQLFQYG